MSAQAQMRCHIPKPLEVSNKPTHVLIDGSGLIFRSYYGIDPMTSPSGVPVQAVYGFCRVLQSLAKDWGLSVRPLVIFDTSRTTFRNEIYEAYKAHRPDTPEDLIPQFNLVRAACDAYGVQRVELAGFEADDLIASYAKAILDHEPSASVVITTVDKDMMQLVRPGVRMYNPQKRIYIDREQVIEKWGVPPEQVVEVMALTGDVSDGVPGVPGIGPKTASDWIRTHGSLEELISNIHALKANGRQQALAQNIDLARLSRRLVLLAENAPLPIAIHELCPPKVDCDQLVSFLTECGFRSLMRF